MAPWSGDRGDSLRDRHNGFVVVGVGETHQHAPNADALRSKAETVEVTSDRSMNISPMPDAFTLGVQASDGTKGAS